MKTRSTSARTRGMLAAITAVVLGVSGSAVLASTSAAAIAPVVTVTQQADAAAEGCTVDGGTLTWGFKESFRSYISGSIANGEWTLADGATYATPQFGWSGAQGAYDPEGGLVAFPGSVTFTGHGGVLNTTVASPQLKFVDDDTAMLLLDVSGTTQDGVAVEQPAIEFVEIDLSGAVEQTGGTLTVTDARTELTVAGAAAFGTYPEGEAFDPLSFTLETECATVMATEEPAEAAQAVPASSHSTIVWSWILVTIALVIVVVAIVVILLRRRRAA